MDKNPPENVHFDAGAFRRTLEATIFKNMMSVLAKDAPEGQRLKMNRIIDIFNMHGIGAVEGMTIIQEIAEVMKDDEERT